MHLVVKPLGMSSLMAAKKAIRVLRAKTGGIIVVVYVLWTDAI